MKIDVERSKYKERPDNDKAFNPTEMDHLRIVLRRLRYLEQKLRDNPNLLAGSGGAMFDRMEVDGLAWLLTEMEFIEEVPA